MLNIWRKHLTDVAMIGEEIFQSWSFSPILGREFATFSLRHRKHFERHDRARTDQGALVLNRYKNIYAFTCCQWRPDRHLNTEADNWETTVHNTNNWKHVTSSIEKWLFIMAMSWYLSVFLVFVLKNSITNRGDMRLFSRIEAIHHKTYASLFFF